MNDVRRARGGNHAEITPDRIEQAFVSGIGRAERGRRADSVHAQVAVLLTLLAEAVDIDLVGTAIEPRKLTREVLHVHAGTAVHVWWVLVGEDRDLAALREARARASWLHASFHLALALIVRRFNLPRDGAFDLFAIGRSAGLLAHALDQLLEGAPIRARLRYVGVEPGAH